VVDVLGGTISKVAEHLKAEPRAQPGLLHGFSDDYFRRVEAVEFAVRHDDGANLHTLYQADLVLTGISRTSKTPLSMYLAQRGYKTGNVPIVPGIDPPTALLDLDPGKVFALAIDPSLLLTIRQARVRVLGVPPHATYADPESLLEEVRRSRRLYREKRWRVVDISGRAAEENAARILRMFEGDSR
jgi:regulator of PEP synthase PpsR (kinase-PPPase family)